jgi:hypothetical protein
MEIINDGVVVPSHRPAPSGELMLVWPAQPFNLQDDQPDHTREKSVRRPAGGSAFDPVEEPTPKNSYRKQKSPARMMAEHAKTIPSPACGKAPTPSTLCPKMAVFKKCGPSNKPDRGGLRSTVPPDLEETVHTFQKPLVFTKVWTVTQHNMLTESLSAIAGAGREWPCRGGRAREEGKRHRKKEVREQRGERVKE